MLTSPSGRPIRRSAATARTVTAQLLENLDASDDEVLGPGDGSAPSAGSTYPAAESLLDPISLSENSAGSPSGSDSAAEGARRSAKARSLHAAIFGSDDEMSDESLPPSQNLKDYLGLGSSEDDEKEGSDWSDGSGPPIRSFLKRTLSTGPYSFTPDDDDDDDDDEDESPEDSEEARVADDALEEGTRHPKPGGDPSRHYLRKSLVQPDPEPALRDPRSKSTVTVGRIVTVEGDRLMVADPPDLS
ncbi:hypothetical protein PInf_026510 [Phytophthora infestans]|nr:hypothetical protein PInf_026510 [Phytophthora infestans]